MHPQDSGAEADPTCAICKSPICPLAPRSKNDLAGSDICENCFNNRCIGVNAKSLG